jgi:peptidoglycan-associated lipoprotein
MKLTKLSSLLALGIVVGIAATGCKRNSYITPLPANGGLVGNGDHIGDGGRLPPGTEVGEGGGILSNPVGSHAGWAEDVAALKAETVYFTYDSSAVRPEEQSKVKAVADYLKSNAAAAVRVEGNCDERGTSEYNRALGERRAIAVREELVRLGIDPTRVDTVSYGYDKPAVLGRDEASMRKNRRDEFVVLTPPGR